jgi:hypothetical protein
MRVIEAIPEYPALATRPDEAGAPEEGELMAHGRLPHAEEVFEVAHAEFGRGKGGEYSEPGGIGEYLEQFPEPIDGRSGGKVDCGLCYIFFVQDGTGTAIRGFRCRFWSFCPNLRRHPVPPHMNTCSYVHVTLSREGEDCRENARQTLPLGSSWVDSDVDMPYRLSALFYRKYRGLDALIRLETIRLEM